MTALSTRESGPPKILTPDYYARMDELERRLGWYRGMQQMILRLVTVYCREAQPLSILDAGCGAGGLLTQLKRFAAPGGLVGLDVSAEALQYCKRRGAFELVQCPLTPLPFAEDSFGLITCADVLQHVEDEKEPEALNELLRVLRPGGILVLRVAAGVGQPTYSHRYYQPHELERRLRRAGFHIEKCSYINRVSYLVQALRRRLDSDCRPEGLPTLPPSALARFVSPHWWKDKLIFYFLQQEAELLANTSRTFRRGTAVLCVARKSAKHRDEE